MYPWGVCGARLRHWNMGLSTFLRPNACRLRTMRPMAVEVGGRLSEGVAAKDLMLQVIGAIGSAGGTGFAIEFRGSAICALDMEAG